MKCRLSECPRPKPPDTLYQLWKSPQQLKKSTGVMSLDDLALSKITKFCLLQNFVDQTFQTRNFTQYSDVVEKRQII